MIQLNMEFVVFSEKHGALAAGGDGLVVYYDYARGRSCEIPGAIVAAINLLEGSGSERLGPQSR